MKKKINLRFERKKFSLACIPLLLPVFHWLVYTLPIIFPIMQVYILFFLIFLEQTAAAPLLWFLPSTIYEYGMLGGALTHLGVIVVGIFYSVLIYVLLSFPKPKQK
ncbi:MAG: hypothetical protein AAB649_00615 [Patescibacteria group bacterium]